MVISLAYEGFELIANAATDVESPRIISRALYASVAVVIVAYIVVALVSAGVLAPSEVIKARDYALAEVASKSIGIADFAIVVAAALASTASAINATLYGTAGISYIVAKYGQLPKELGRNIWRRAPEGLVAIAVLSLLLVNLEGLEAISYTGSSGFLLVFGFVNLAAYRLRERVKATPLIPLLGVASTFTSLMIMAYRAWLENRLEVILFIAVVALSSLIEYLYRLYAGRELGKYMTHYLRQGRKR